MADRIRLAQRVTMSCRNCNRSWISVNFSAYCCGPCRKGRGHSSSCNVAHSLDDIPVRGPPPSRHPRRDRSRSRNRRFNRPPQAEIQLPVNPTPTQHGEDEPPAFGKTGTEFLKLGKIGSEVFDKPLGLDGPAPSSISTAEAGSLPDAEVSLASTRDASSGGESSGSDSYELASLQDEEADSNSEADEAFPGNLPFASEEEPPFMPLWTSMINV